MRVVVIDASAYPAINSTGRQDGDTTALPHRFPEEFRDLEFTQPANKQEIS